MSWRQGNRRIPGRPEVAASHLPFRLNQRCFIRKEHECGKVFAASKSCFIACPTEEDIEPMLELISEKLTKHGIEPIIAVRERAYGQDIFCTKICGKIIESKFCLVILDDTIRGECLTSNPNVYYEYGLMTSLAKHIIPLQKDGQQLAFNIQSYDTIKYNPKNMSAEMERAIREAIRITDTDVESPEVSNVPEKTIMRRLELAGFVAKDYNWFLNSVIEDTQFRGFGGNTTVGYLYLGKIDTEEDTRTYLEDLDVVLLRTEKKAEELSARQDSLRTKIAESLEGLEEGYRKARILPYSVEKLKEELPTIESKLGSMGAFYIGFLVNPSIDLSTFRERVQAATIRYPRFSTAFSEGNGIKFGDVEVDLTASGDWFNSPGGS